MTDFPRHRSPLHVEHVSRAVTAGLRPPFGLRGREGLPIPCEPSGALNKTNLFKPPVLTSCVWNAWRRAARGSRGTTLAHPNARRPPARVEHAGGFRAMWTVTPAHAGFDAMLRRLRPCACRHPPPAPLSSCSPPASSVRGRSPPRTSCEGSREMWDVPSERAGWAARRAWRVQTMR
eukprot:7377555-Prymnesium_polylepis.1